MPLLLTPCLLIKLAMPGICSMEAAITWMHVGIMIPVTQYGHRRKSCKALRGILWLCRNLNGMGLNGSLPDSLIQLTTLQIM